MGQIIKLAVHQENLLKNLGYTFTSGTTFVGELLQNARRSGASSIDVDFENEAEPGFPLSVSFTDDGKGVPDFQKLLTVAESGWNAAVVDDEHPFGMGFLSALFAADEVEVRSGGQGVVLRLADLLDGKTAEVGLAPSKHSGATTVTLRGLHVGAGVLEDALKDAGKGFPLPIRVNEFPLSRPHALDALKTIHTPVGELALASGGDLEIETLPSLADRCYLYLHGLPIRATEFGDRYDIRRWVLHLDGSQFLPRMPDRTDLIDGEVAIKRISGVLKEALVTELQSRLRRFGPEVFAARCFTDALRICPEMLNRIDYVPSAALRRITDVPFHAEPHSDWTWHEALTDAPAVLSHAEFDCGRYRLIDDDEILDHPLAGILADRDGLYIVNPEYRLPRGHWLETYAPENPYGTIKLVCSGEKEEVLFSGCCVYQRVVFCDHVDLIPEHGDPMTCSDFPVWSGQKIYVPKTVDLARCDCVLDFMESFIDDSENYRSDWRDDDCTAFVNLVRAHLPPDRADILTDVISRSALRSSPAFVGKTFTVSFDGKDVTVVEA